MEIALSIAGGLVLLVVGGEFLVRGAVRIAETIGVSPLLIGLTIVGFGTSTPELVTSVHAALIGSPGIAVGNIVGSNLFNVLVILGIAALITPLAVSATALRRDGVFGIVTAALFVAVGYVWTLERVTGAALLLLLAGYLYYAYRQERVGGADGHTAAFDKGEALQLADAGLTTSAAPSGTWFAPLLTALGGLVVLVVGARFLVEGSIDLAKLLGVSDTVIGLTIVAAGTSMPELATSAIAAFRRQSDVAIGNVLGSNIYNILGIGGVTAVIAPTDIPAQIVAFDSLVMLGVSVLLLVFLYTGSKLSRWEGGALFAGYLAYLWAIWPQP